MKEGADLTALHLLCPACRGGLVHDKETRCTRCDRVYAEDAGILCLVAGGVGAPGFDPHYFEALSEVEEDHFWFVTRREVILDALRRTVPDLGERALFDIGCGSGGLVAFLSRSGVRLAGACDAYLEGLRLARSRVQAPLIQVDEGRLPPLGAGQKLIGLFDVLEHLDDDRGTLAWVASILEPGGVLVLTVPAHPFLFDEMDELAHHRRRYVRGDLRAKLEAAGLEVRLLNHFMAFFVPGLVVLRRVGRWISRDVVRRRATELRVVPWLNPIVRGLLRLERAWMRLVPLPFGTSLVAVAARPRAPTSAGSAPELV